MNRLHLLSWMISTCLVTSSAVRAQTVPTSQILQTGSTCDHVIRQVARHGVNNRFDRSTLPSMHHGGPLGPFAFPLSELGDLEIIDVRQIAHEEANCGPKFAITISNQSSRAVKDFHVAATATLGAIHRSSPVDTVRVACVKAGQAVEVHVTLPIEAFAMGNRNGQVIGFQNLIVVIDCFDELLETDEANNVKAYRQSELPTVPVAEVPVVTDIDTVNEQPSVVQSAPFDDAPIPSDPLRSALNKVQPQGG
ncbi:MAG: hypothetical protein AAGA03_15045 [Planctomycetota bacterium]